MNNLKNKLSHYKNASASFNNIHSLYNECLDRSRSLSPIRLNKNTTLSPFKNNLLGNSSPINNKSILTSSYSFSSVDSFVFSPSTSCICLQHMVDSPKENLYNIEKEYYYNCKYCNCNFMSHNKKNKYCSYKCYKLKRYDNIKKEFKIKCKTCKNIFTTKNLFTDYCSNICFTLR